MSEQNTPKLPGRRISLRLSMHILREFGIPLLCSLMAFAFLFMVNNIFDDLPDFLSKNVPIPTIVMYFLALQPHNLLNVVPISVLLAASFMTVMLGRNNELCAMRAAGLSLAACALPIWIIAALAALCVAGISESWGQSSSEYAAAIKTKWTENKSKNKPQPVAIVNLQQHRDWSVETGTAENSFNNVTVRQHDENGKKTRWLIAAQSAFFKDGQWTFQNGIRQFFNDDIKNTPQSAVSFKELQLNLEELPSDLKENAGAFDVISIREAWSILHREHAPSRKNADKLWVIIWYNLTFPLASIVAALFGFSMTIAHQRSECMRGFALAIGILVLFYIIGQVSLVMGQNGWIPPFIAGGLPSLAFLVAGIINVWRKQ